MPSAPSNEILSWSTNRGDNRYMTGFDSRFERLIDKQIREATERGSFDDLPGQGKPLPDSNVPYSEDWWLEDLAKREDVGPYPLPEPPPLRREADDLLAGTA